VDFDEICNVCFRKAIIKAAKAIISSDKMCRSYTDLNFGATFLEHRCIRLRFVNVHINESNIIELILYILCLLSVLYVHFCMLPSVYQKQ